MMNRPVSPGSRLARLSRLVLAGGVAGGMLAEGHGSWPPASVESQ
ncbi:MAG: hypothetical protein R3E95_04160 [Thiolinea sp.]